MTLIVAAVVVISMLQAESDEFGDYSEDQRNSSSCNFQELEYERAINKETCSETAAAKNIRKSSNCDWAESSDQSGDYC